MQLYRGNGSLKRGLAAFTLIEVMIAVVIIGVMTFSLYAGFAFGFTMVQMSREDLRATQILMQRVEGLRLCTWSSLSNCPINFQTSYDPTVTNAGTIYYGSITTNAATGIPNTAAYNTNMCLLTATITWTNYFGSKTIPHSRQVQSYIARYGLQSYFWGKY
jgi:prepilin-type N-terminal cleavage/methylation domain-containing protein